MSTGGGGPVEPDAPHEGKLEYAMHNFEAPDLGTLIYSQEYGLKAGVNKLVQEGWTVVQMDHSTVAMTDDYGRITPRFFCIVTFSRPIRTVI